MTNEFMIILLSLFILNILLLYNFKKISLKMNIFDFPSERKIHQKPIPPLGGTIFFINFLFIYFFSTIFRFEESFLNGYFLTALSLMFLLGLVDDKKNLNSKNKFLILSILIFVHLFMEQKYIIDFLDFDFIGYSLNFNTIQGIFFTLLCILLFVNASNLYDGINLQFGLYSLFILCYLIFKNPNLILIKLSLIPLIFFIYLNYKNKCFFGDSGTLLFSYMISLVIIDQHLNQKTLMISEILLLMIIPGIDMFRLFLKRIILKKNPFHGDRKHIHHILLKKFSLFNTNIILLFLNIMPILIYNYLSGYFISILFCLIVSYSCIILYNDK